MPGIIAGKRRGAHLLVPEGLGVRPTLARVREALFSMMASAMGTFENLCVLDPFAGAGLLGLEAWSRGAAHVDFFEMARPHFEILNKNIATLGAQNEVRAILGQTPRDWGKVGETKYDLVLCDPPYAAGLMPQTLEALIARSMLNAGALVSVEYDEGQMPEIPGAFEIFRQRSYGRCQILLLQLKVA